MAKGGFKARGLKGGNSNGGSNVDWKAIHDQVDEGTHGARISVMIDLGMHKEGMALGGKGQTGFLTMEDAEQWLEEAKKTYGAKHAVFKDGDPDVEDADDVDLDDKIKTLVLEEDGSWSVSKEDPEYVVQANEYGGEREYQELAIFADLTENPVDYGETIGVKPFRVLLNRRWMQEINGFQLKKSPPAKKGDPWTVKGNTKLAELATATGHKDLLEVDLEDADWSEMLGEAFNLAIEKSGDEGQYLNIGKCVSVKRKKNKATGKIEVEEVEDLEHEAVLITFEDVTVEDLELAHIRGDIIKKIKTATDYKGSQMQKAIEEFEARQKAKGSDKKAKEDDVDDSNDDDDDVDEKPARKVNKVEKTKTKPKTQPKEEKPADEDNDGQNDNDEDWED